MKRRILYHILFWLVYFIWSGFVSGAYDRLFYRSYVTELFHLPLKLVVTYFLMYFVIPLYFEKRNIGQFILTLLLLIFLSTFVHRIIIYTLIQPLFYPDYSIAFWNYGKILYGAFDVFSVAAIAICIKLFKTRYESVQREKELKTQKLTAELNFLKAQMNPHFLFNTLNNIYALSLNNSPETSNSILKLSELLRFMIHDGSLEKIRLSEEISTLKDYIELEKLRYGDRLNIIFEKDIDNENEMIAPLLLLPFVENSFKHGASESRFASSLNISLYLKNGILTFKVINSKENEEPNKHGIGLKNIKRQLELIYGKYHSLEIKNSSQQFEVSLTINIAEHAKTELSNN